MHYKVVNMSRKTHIFKPLAERNHRQLIFQGTGFITTTMAAFLTTGSLGHNIVDFNLGQFMTPTDISAVMLKWKYWQLKSIQFSTRVFVHNNTIKFTNLGGPITNYMWSDGPNEDKYKTNLFFGVFNNDADQQAAMSLDPDHATNYSRNRSKLLQNFNYKKLDIDGKRPIHFGWTQPPTAIGGYMTIPASMTPSTTLSTAFGPSLPSNNQFHGYDTCLFDRPQYSQQITGDGMLSFQLQCIGTIVIQFDGNHIDDY